MSGSGSTSRLLIPACVFLIGLSFLTQVGYLSRTGFVTYDDRWLDWNAASVRTHGLVEYGRQAVHMAKLQGRFGYIASWSLFLAPYFVSSDLIRAFLIALMQFLSWICLAWFLAWYTSKTDAWVLLGLICCLLPYMRGFWPVGSVLLAYTAAILLFFFGMSIYLRVRSGALSKWGGAGRALALASIGLSLFVYESLDAAFGLVAALSLWPDAGQDQMGGRKRLTVMLRRDWPVFALFAGYALFYVAFRVAVSAAYTGTTISLSSVTKVGAAWNVIWRFALLGQPAVNFFARLDGLTSYWVNNPRASELIPFVINNLSLVGFLKAVVGALILYWFGRSWGAPCAPAAGRVTDAVIPGTAVVLAFALQIPLALTPKYQEVAGAWAPYLTGYFSFLCLTVAGWGVIRLLAQALAGRGPRAATPVFAGLGVALLLVAAMNSIAGEGVFRMQARHYLKWRLMNALLQTTVFRDLPQGAVIVSPTLWEGIERDWDTGRDRYWSEYIRRHSGRILELLPEMPPNAAGLITVDRLYAGEIQRGFDDDGALLLLSKITRQVVGAAKETYVSDDLAIIGYRDYKDLAITLVTAGKGPDRASFEGGPFQFGPLTYRGLPSFQPDHGAWVTREAQADMIVGAWRLTSARLTPIGRPLVEVAFGAGFSMLETQGERYWEWSDGKEGTGLVNLINHTGAPLRVRFEATVLTASEQPSRFDLLIQGKPETTSFRLNERFERVLVLQPGSNEIRFHSHGARIAAPMDGRYLVFGLQNWVISAVEPEAGR